jgi:hypothetical protein
MNAESPVMISPDMRDTASAAEVQQIHLTQSNGVALNVAVPAGDNVIRIPVISGAVIRLPFSEEGLSVRLDDENGNLAVKSGETTVILLNYAAAVAEGEVTLLAADGQPIDVAAVLASTDPNIDIQTAGGPGAGDLGVGVDNTGGVFEPFDPLDGIGGLTSVGGLQQTALSYTVIEVEVAQFDPEEEADGADGSTTPEEPTGLAPINFNDANAGAENVYRDTNVMVVLDISGSMKEDANDSMPGIQSRMDVAKAVLANLLLTYDSLGDVRVTVVVFNEGAALHFTWGTVAAAIASLDTLVPEDRTNYAAAIETAQIAWAADGKLPGDTESIIYFLSDGKPTVGGGSGNHLTDGQKTAWNDFLENPANGIDHVYAVGIGDDVNAADDDLLDVARPDGNNLPAGDVILVNDPAADLASELIGTIEGQTISGNVLNGADTSGIGDNGTAGEADVDGDGATYIHAFSHESAEPGFAVAFAWDGVSDSLTQVGAGGNNVVFNGLEVSFDTDHGRMTFSFSTGDYVFTPSGVSSDTDVAFHYGTRDADGDLDQAGGVDGDGALGGADLVLTILDTTETSPALAAANVDMPIAMPYMPPMPYDEGANIAA